MCCRARIVRGSAGRVQPGQRDRPVRPAAAPYAPFVLLPYSSGIMGEDPGVGEDPGAYEAPDPPGKPDPPRKTGVAPLGCRFGRAIDPLLCRADWVLLDRCARSILIYAHINPLSSTKSQVSGLSLDRKAGFSAASRALDLHCMLASTVSRRGGDPTLPMGRRRPTVRAVRGTRATGSFSSRAGIIPAAAKLSLCDSSHLTAEAPAGKLERGLLNFNTNKDCSWHVR
jgi:hypothetical protein